MKCVTTIFALLAFVLGMAAAWYWFKASRVEVEDPYPQDGVSRNVEEADFVLPTIEALSKSARLNKIAAILTGLAVISGTLGNLVGDWQLSPCSPK